jgi:hypothetical protein
MVIDYQANPDKKVPADISYFGYILATVTICIHPFASGDSNTNFLQQEFCSQRHEVCVLKLPSLVSIKQSSINNQFFNLSSQHYNYIQQIKARFTH